MSRILSLIKVLKSIDVEKEVLAAIDANKEEFVEWNREQLLAGRTSKNVELPPYSEASVRLFGKRPGPWQLYETGDFHESIFMSADRFPVFVDATDAKTDLILEKLEKRGYDSVTIFGLNQENLEKMRDNVRKGFQLRIRKILGIR